MDYNLRLTLAQTTLAKKLGLSRQWVGEVVQRLDEAGWLVHVSPTFPDGTNEMAPKSSNRCHPSALIEFSVAGAATKATVPEFGPVSSFNGSRRLTVWSPHPSYPP
jgi:hypothetical protein